MEISNGIWVLKNLFTVEECRKWIELTNSIIQNQRRIVLRKNIVKLKIK